MAKVTVITTCFNTEKYIRESLDSIFEQTFKDFDLVLLDDGSTDRTKEIAEEYANKYSSVITLLSNKKNEGIPYSRNKAILKATGKYIAIHDADDISMPNRLESEVNFLDENDKISFIGSFAYRISTNGADAGSISYPPENTEEAFSLISRYKINPIIDPTSMFKAKDIIEHGGYTMDNKLKTVLGFELWCRMLCHGYKMANIRKYLIKYRINPNGVTRTENQSVVEATDTVWSKFRRKTFLDPHLSPELFEKQDTLKELWNQ